MTKIRITRMHDDPYIVWMFSDGDYFLHISESVYSIRRSINRFRYVRATLAHAREMFKLGRKQLQEEKIP